MSTEKDSTEDSFAHQSFLILALERLKLVPFPVLLLQQLIGLSVKLVKQFFVVKRAGHGGGHDSHIINS